MKRIRRLLANWRTAVERWHWRNWNLRRWWALRAANKLEAPFNAGYQGEKWTTEEIGRLGEDLAAQWLVKSGRTILKRNHKAAHGGEVDIVCRERDVLCFVEVKTRTKQGWHRPADAVNAEKQRLIQRGARDWLKHLRCSHAGWRYDIMEVVLEEGQPPRLNCVIDAFKDSSASARR